MAGDITIAQTTGADTAAYSYMLGSPVVMQDITPASVRRSDGDTRFQTLQTEGFWSQSDWSNGFGMREQKDPTSYYTGLVDTSFAGQAICAQTLDAYTVTDRYPVAMCEHAGYLYAVFYVESGAATYDMYRLDASGWTATGYSSAVAVTDICSYRGNIYVGRDSGGVVVYTTGSAAFTALTCYAKFLCPYAGMLHYIWANSAPSRWSLSRYDPDNANYLLVGNFDQWDTFGPRAMRAAYGYLYITFYDSLWSYKTENGNTGILTGPLDRWTPTNHSGQALEAHDGAMVYNAGPVLRRYPPNGAPRVLFPTAPREATNDTAWGEPVALRSLAGRLYVAVAKQFPMNGATTVNSSTTNFVRLLCWNGQGMHRVANADQSGSSRSNTLTKLGYDGRGRIAYIQDFTSASSSGWPNTGAVVVPIISGNLVTDAALISGSACNYTTSTLETGRITFGLDDVIKAIRRWRYRAGTGGTITVAYTTDDTNWTTLVTSGLTESTPTGQYDQVFKELMKSGDGTVSNKWFRFRVTLTPSSATTTPVLTALTCIPNPAMPLRKGFKLSVLIGQHVQDYAGTFLYPTSADVTAALTRVEALRAKGDTTDPATNGPLTLVWVDGTTYTVRANTIVVHRVRMNPIDAPYWNVVLDCQEVV